MKIRHYNVIFYPEPEGGFTAVVPTLPGCVSYGHDLVEAKKMIKDAMEGYIISLKKHKEPVPSDEDAVTSFIDIWEHTSTNYAEDARTLTS